MSQNKLEEYRDGKASELYPIDIGTWTWNSGGENEWSHAVDENEDHREGYIEGFDAAIALDLPVKFAIWLALNGIKTDYKDIKGEIHWYKMELASHQHKGTTKELYQYWIDNVYKPE